MAAGGSAIRGSRVGAGPMGEQKVAVRGLNRLEVLVRRREDINAEISRVCRRS